MAESYRGLTIRIGGDTSKLSQALRAADRSVSDTTSVLKKLNDAVKLDPSSIEAASLQMGAMASSAAATAMKLAGLREAIKQVGTMEFDGKSVRELAEGTKNAQINANIAREAYVKLTDSLAQMYTKVTDLVGKQAELASKGFMAKLKEEVDLGKVSVESLKEAIDQLAPAIRPSEEATERFLTTVSKLKTEYLAAAAAEEEALKAAAAATTKRDTERYEKQAAKAHNELVDLNQQYDKLVNNFSKLSGEVFNFDNGNVSLTQLRSALENLPASIRPGRTEINNFITEVARLKVAFKEADDELEKANIIAQFEQLTAEAVKTDASIMSIVHAMSEMKTPSDVMRGMTEQTEAAKALNEAYQENMRVGKEMADAYKADPSNVEALAAAEKAFAAAAQNANEGLAKQQEISSGFDKNRASIEAFTDTTKSAQEQLNEATIAQSKAADEVARLEGNIANAQLEMRQLGGAASEASKEFKDKVGEMSEEFALVSEMSDEFVVDEENQARYDELSEKTRKWRIELEAAQEVEEELAHDVDMAKQRAELEKSEQGVVRWSNRAAEALDAAKALHKADAAPEFDTSAAEQLEALIKQLSNKSLESTGFGTIGKELEALRANIKAADDQLKILDAALKVDPKNVELLGQKTELVATRTRLAQTEQKKLNILIAQLETTQLDKAAIESGTLAGKLAEAKKAAEDGAASMKGYEKTIGELEKQLSKLEEIKPNKRTEKQKQDIENLKAVLEALRASYKTVADTANQATAEMGREVRTQQYVDAKNRVIELDTAEKNLGRTADETHKKDGTPKIDEAAFMQVVDRIAQAARHMGQEIVQSANEVDTAYRNMRKTVNGTEEQFETLKQSAIEFSQSSVTSADTMLEMQALGGQLGILVEDLEQFGKIGSNLDIATDMDAEDIALRLGQISNVLNLDIEGTQGFADALVRLGNNMPAQESAIMNVAQRFAAVASTASFSGDEILAWSASIASTGQRSEAAATAISNTVSGIEQAVANGGSDLKQFAAIASMSADEFIESWKESPTQTLRAFIEGLKTLKDSDESAVAALENMGITGVRQQQTLLALTQTVDNLDKALGMSYNAWNGVSDQWGKAGDAAIEAQKKSEGFSGALAILQNNAQNLMASMGDTLVPLLKNVSDILEFVTDVFNNLPAPIKTLVVKLGGATIAFSTLGRMMSVFSSGMAGTIKAIGEAHSIGEFISLITGFSKAAEGATAAAGGLEAAAGGLGAAFSGPVVLGIAAAVAALMVVIAKINEYNEHQQTVIDATDGLTRAMSEGKASYDTYVAGAQESSRSVLELKDAINEATEAQANYAEEVRSAWDGISASEAEVDILVQKIEELASKGSLTTEEQNELNAAVKSFNNVCGENVHVLDAQSGMLDTTIDDIKGMADAWESGLENDQLIKQYASNVEQIAEKQKLLDEVNQKLKSANPDQWFTDMRDGAGFTAASYADLTKQAETLESEIASLQEQQRQTVAEMDNANEALGMVEAGLREQGQSLSDYGQFTDEELQQITDLYEKWSFNSSLAIQKVIDLLNELKGGSGAASEIARQLEETSKAADKARAEAYKAEATDEYNARKAELDKIYNDTKRSYDAQYNELKQSLDAEYNEKKRQLDRQYDLRKRALDKDYDAQKQAYDKQYDALKRSLDRQYDAQKLKLDHELDAIKKSNDAKLQALKRRFDNEEDAYKEATDHQVKELERKHKLEIRAIEDERDARVKAIDEQIRALEALNDAEQHEVDKTKQDNKIAELQKEVDSAKSRRKKAEAEKKLNEYLQEVEVKRRKWERDLQIEDLKLQKEAIKEEADARKDAANDKYDIEKEAFKNARDAELELLKQANDDRYNAMKLALEAEEQAKKEANDLALENIKYNHQDQLQELKDHNDAQLAALKEKNELELQSIKDNNDMILQSMKDAHSAQLDSLKNSQSIELENRKSAQTKELQDLKAYQNARYKQIKAGQDAEGQAERAKNQQILKEEAEAQRARSEAQDRHLYSMEQRMQEMGDKNIRTSSEANKTINANTENELSNLSSTYRDRFQESMDAISRVFGDNSGMVATEAQNIANSAQAPFSSMTADQYTSGWHFISNFVSGVQEAWGRGGWGGVFEYLASQVQSLWGHSVPKKGPLSDDDKWGGHFVENIVDGMRSKEKELYRQVEKMADAVEEGFDPTLSVDAAFEALDTIGKNRGKSLEVLADSKSAPVVNVTLNMNLSGVSIREDADIERLAKAMSQEMAAQAARQIAGRLG